MFRCPTSELPIWPGGSPTARPDASSVVHEQFAKSSSKRGLSACAMALNSVSLRQPKPSRTMRMIDGRLGLTRRKISGRSFFALEDHADVIGCAGLEVDGGDAHQLPPFIAE